MATAVLLLVMAVLAVLAGSSHAQGTPNPAPTNQPPGISNTTPVSPPAPAGTTTLGDALNAINATLLIQGIQLSGLNNTLLRLDQPFAGTLFAPSNEAFLAMLSVLQISATDFINDPNSIRPFILYHATQSVLPTSGFRNTSTSYTTLQADGRTISTQLVNGSAMVLSTGSNATVVVPDTPMVNASGSVVGYVQGIDVALTPFYITGYLALIELPNTLPGPTFNILLQAIQLTGLTAYLNNTASVYTLLAPSDAVFAKLLVSMNTTLAALTSDIPLLTSILKQHVIPDQALQSVWTLNRTIYPSALGGRFNLMREPYYRGGSSVWASAGSYGNVNYSVNAANTRQAVHLIDTALLPLATNLANILITDNILSTTPLLSRFDILIDAFYDVGYDNISGDTTGIYLYDPWAQGVLLAPTDEAMTRGLASVGLTRDDFVKNVPLMMAVLRLHYVPGTTLFGTSYLGTSVPSIGSTPLLFTNVTNATVLQARVSVPGSNSAAYNLSSFVPTLNGRSGIYALDTMLLPTNATLFTAPPSPPPPRPPPAPPAPPGGAGAAAPQLWLLLGSSLLGWVLLHVVAAPHSG